MSKTHIHVGKGLFNNKIDKPKSVGIKKYLNHCDRHNGDKGEGRQLRNMTKEKIANRDMIIDVDGCDFINGRIEV
jgi:hypothetical protein